MHVDLFAIVGTACLIGFFAAAIFCGILFCELVDWVQERDE